MNPILTELNQCKRDNRTKAMDATLSERQVKHSFTSLMLKAIFFQGAESEVEPRSLQMTSLGSFSREMMCHKRTKIYFFFKSLCSLFDMELNGN